MPLSANVPTIPILDEFPIVTYVFLPSFSSTYLVCHDSLLETRANHGLLARRLAPAPDALAVGCLHGTHLLAGLYALLQDPVHAALRGRRGGIGGRDGGARLAGFGVVGRDRVVVGGAVGAAQDRHTPGEDAEGS